MENYAANSYKAKADLAAATTEQKEEKKVEKIISGNVVARKKSIGRKMFDTFVQEDAGTVKNYILTDVVVPTIKRAIVDTVQLVLYGHTSSNNRNGSNRSTYVSYEQYYARDPRNRQRTVDRRANSVYECQEVTLEDRGDAEDVLRSMNNLINIYRVVSVADLYDLVGMPTNYTDNNYGWTDLTGTRIIRDRDGYFILDLPKPSPID